MIFNKNINPIYPKNHENHGQKSRPSLTGEKAGFGGYLIMVLAPG